MEVQEDRKFETRFVLTILQIKKSSGDSAQFTDIDRKALIDILKDAFIKLQFKKCKKRRNGLIKVIFRVYRESQKHENWKTTWKLLTDNL